MSMNITVHCNAGAGAGAGDFKGEESRSGTAAVERVASVALAGDLAAGTRTVEKKAVKIAKILQKECVISRTRNIAVGTFGPCYVLSGSDKTTGYHFLAHIDDTTSIESVKKIFTTLKELGARSIDHVSLQGGWKHHVESNKWGNALKVLLKENLPDTTVDLSHFQTKVMSSKGRIHELGLTHRAGGILNVKTGVFSDFKQPWESLERKQHTKNEENQRVFHHYMASFSASSIEVQKERARAFAYQEYPLKVTVL